MYFTDKRKKNWIQKEDRVLDQVRPPDRVEFGYGGARAVTIFILIEKDKKSYFEIHIKYF